jgi:hypothetical protein
MIDRHKQNKQKAPETIQVDIQKAERFLSQVGNDPNWVCAQGKTVISKTKN